MKTFIQCIIFAILTFTSPFLDAQEKIIVCPNELQQEWANAEIGVIIHFDMPVFHPDYNWRQFGTHPSPSTFNPSSLLISFVFFLLVAVTEELALRGFVLERMLQGGINKFWALFFSSVLFSLIHIGNPNFNFLSFINILLAGALLGSSYIYTRNLCFPIALHWFWNWIQGPVLGYEVSGNKFGESMLTLHLPEANLMNGGAFGFEGSMLCTVLMILGTGVILKMFRIKDRKVYQN